MEVRVAAEVASFLASAPAMIGLLKRGHGRPVLVLPGFLAGDGSTAPLRGLLRGLGHDVHGWGLGRNIGPTDEILDGMIHLVDELRARTGSIDIIGWSLGGLYAREVARLAPEVVHQVITLGSPFQTTGPEQSRVGLAFNALHDRHSDRVMIPRIPSWAREPMPVPTTSIYSRTDGIVRWHHCLNRHLPTAENVEVRGTHCGLAMNPAAVLVIADRLAQKAGRWRPFRPPLAVRGLFPHSDVYEPPAA
ncbi:MAG: alpha/beta hydrolase [Actinobacteria bacterium]|nr:alpha/beta hydrolase [Actinomycetota bacterium]NIS34966.1 alpha/beta hydrolase [Actinomycetota bacterium]NIT97402.1 alpha/beta hydrolase [Actinomycetota bacterium]NIU21071.1 alpha/beta hydrolase [Actinomycetota bacterium]NIU69113.1 alpha/beta hydrolase [Actinomycetota bacterium]